MIVGKRVYRKIISFVLLMNFFVLFSSTQSYAAEKTDDTVYQLETVQVTAQKREESVQKVPAAVSVYSETFIEDTGSNNLIDLLRFSPNVFNSNQESLVSPYIRGIGANGPTALFSAVAIYIDDVLVPSTYETDQALFDIERVEILKGPQGTLYGGNSEAGVINIVTKQPGNTWTGRIALDGSFWDTRQNSTTLNREATVQLSGPIKEDLLYIGLAGQWGYDGGFTKNEVTKNENVGDQDKFNVRGKLRYTPTDDLDITFSSDVVNSHDGVGVGRLRGDVGPLFPGGPTYPAVGYGQINRASDSEYVRDWTGNSQNLRVKYSGDSVDVLSITARRYFNDDAKWDNNLLTSLTPFIGLTTVDQKQEIDLWSQEFRLSSPAESESPFSWLVGAYFSRQNLNVQSGQLTEGAQPRDHNYDMDVIMNNYAAFVDATYTLFDRLHLTAGLRYDYLEQYGDSTISQAGSNFGIGPYNGSHNFSKNMNNAELLPKISVSYDVTDNNMVYATVSKGYLAGGYDYFATDINNFTYDPEYTWNYEIGSKNSFLDNKLIVNASAFYIDIMNKQVSQTISISQVRIANAAEATSYGVELEVQALPYKGVTIYGNIGYNKTEIDSWKDPGSAGIAGSATAPAAGGTAAFDYSGKSLNYAPELTYSLGGMYIHDTGIFGRIDVLGHDGYYFDAKNDYKQDGYATVNARVGYLGDNFEVTLYCDNLFGQEYLVNEAPVPMLGTSFAFDGAPRQIGLTVAYKF